MSPLVFLAGALVLFSPVWAVILADVKTIMETKCVPNPPILREYMLSLPFAQCKRLIRKGMAARHPDQNKNTSQILETYNYPYEVYSVTTEDGYILTVYRITGSPNLKDQENVTKQAVYLQHGLTAASDTWNFQPGNRNLPFKLADAGYEVWLGNARGTSYSMRHTELKPETLEYWDFSWHEVGVYDLPAVTDKILEVSRNDKIFYVGHSMGTTEYFVSLSEVPEMNNKIRAAFMLAPVIYMGHLNSAGRLAFPLFNKDPQFQLVNFALRGHINSTMQIRQNFNMTQGDICDLTALKCGLCNNLVFAAFGYNAPQMNLTELPNIIAKVPNSLSIKMLAHYAQSGSFCRFRKYDYGPFKNLEVYGSTTAPDYNLSNIKAPIYMIYAENDQLGPPNDVEYTASKLNPGVVKGMYKVKDKLFNHVDFVLAKDADKLVYNQILSDMQSYK